MLLTMLTCLQQPLEAVLPLRDQWAACCRALSAGQAGQAVILMNEFENWYGSEAAVRDREFREPYLRLRGLAMLQAGDGMAAIPILEEWLEAYSGQQRFTAFVRFQLARAYLIGGNEEAAIGQWKAFLAAHPELPECALVHWMWADLLVRREAFSPARDHLEAVLREERLPPGGKALATAALALADLCRGDHLAGFGQLSQAGTNSPVLGVWRSLLAPFLAARLLQAGSIEEAVKAAAWMDRAQNLARRMNRLRPSDRSSKGIRAAIWAQHWQGQLSRLNRNAGSDSFPLPDTEQLYRLRLEILLRSKAFQDALILGRAILRNGQNRGPELRAAAYSAAIESCRELRKWDQGESLADEFCREFPQDPALPDILFLQARTAGARGDPARAIDLVDQLTTLFPGHGRVSSWKLSGAGWRLENGRAAEALPILDQLREEAPASWEAFLFLEMARCHQSLGNTAEALSHFHQVIGHNGAGGLLKEHAWTGLLKLHLSGMDWTAFEKGWSEYRDTFKQGLNRPVVQNLAATALRLQGRVREAMELLVEVSHMGSPLAEMAHEQLSEIHRESGALDLLRAHALEWLQQWLERRTTLPRRALEDCLHWQRASAERALPESLLLSLLEELASGEAGAGAPALFSLLQDQWPAYREALEAPGMEYPAWIEDEIRSSQLAERWNHYVVLQLEAARLLENQQRTDSADARRIRILQAVPREELGQAGLIAAGTIAHRYDFPEATTLLETALDKFPGAAERADLLHMLALRCRAAGQTETAVNLLAEVLRDWADAEVHTEAGLQLAKLHLSGEAYPDCLSVLEQLLKKPGLAPAQAAQVLLLRAEADMATGNSARALVGCQRVLTLYPAVAGVGGRARNLLESRLDSLFGEQLEWARDLIRKSESAEREDRPNA